MNSEPKSKKKTKKEKPQGSNEYIFNQEDCQKWTQLGTDRRRMRANVASNLKKLRKAYRQAGCAPIYKDGRVVAYAYNMDIVHKKHKPKNFRPGIDRHYVIGAV